jgi:hypothetical protein
MKQRRDRRASVVCAEFFLHPCPVNNTFNVQKRLQMHGGVVGFQPIDLRAERKNRQNCPEDVMDARPTGSHDTGNEDHGEN